MDKTIRLVYHSKTLRDMSLDDIQSILESARANNSDLGICGMLCYESRWFLQVLEGERSAVSELFLDIADDPRHDEIEIVSFEYIDEPQFADWRMGYAADTAHFAAALAECNLSVFEPPELEPEVSLDLLLHLSRSQAEASTQATH